MTRKVRAGRRPLSAMALAAATGAAFLREIAPHYVEAAPNIPLTRVDIHAGNWPEGIVIGARLRKRSGRGEF